MYDNLLCSGMKECGSIRVADQLDSSCAVILVGGGAKPATPDNVARLFNFVYNTFGASIRVPAPILNVLINDDK